MWSTNINIDTNLYHFIYDDSSFTFVVWEDLEVDFSNINRRYCEKYNDYVYRASNVSVLNKLYSENKRVAISANLFELIREEISNKEYQLFQNRLKVTLFLMIYFKSKSKYIHEHDCESLMGCIDTKTMKEILENIIGDRNALEWLGFFKQHGIDMEFIILETLDYINDDTFSHTFMEKLKIL